MDPIRSPFPSPPPPLALANRLGLVEERHPVKMSQKLHPIYQDPAHDVYLSSQEGQLFRASRFRLRRVRYANRETPSGETVLMPYVAS